MQHLPLILKPEHMIQAGKRQCNGRHIGQIVYRIKKEIGRGGQNNNREQRNDGTLNPSPDEEEEIRQPEQVTQPRDTPDNPVLKAKKPAEPCGNVVEHGKFADYPAILSDKVVACRCEETRMVLVVSLCVCKTIALPENVCGPGRVLRYAQAVRSNKGKYQDCQQQENRVFKKAAHT